MAKTHLEIAIENSNRFVRGSMVEGQETWENNLWRDTAALEAAIAQAEALARIANALEGISGKVSRIDHN